MHKPIKKYTHDGYIRDDKDFIRLRGELERLMQQQMRDEGYVPVYEIGVHWSTEWEPTNKRYAFKLSMFGSYAGKRQATQYNYWHYGRLV
jgi:hypothetical protein